MSHIDIYATRVLLLVNHNFRLFRNGSVVGELCVQIPVFLTLSRNKYEKLNTPQINKLLQKKKIKVKNILEKKLSKSTIEKEIIQEYRSLKKNKL